MNAIRQLFAAFANLAASVNALAGIIDHTSGRIRQQLDHEPAALANGEVIDNAADADSTPAAKRNGRKPASV